MDASESSQQQINTPVSLRIQHGGRHYKDLVIQPAEYNHRNRIPFCASEAIKYLTRHEFKNGQEDVRKAIHFCQMILDFDYGIQTEVLYGEDAASYSQSREAKNSATCERNAGQE